MNRRGNQRDREPEGVGGRGGGGDWKEALELGKEALARQWWETRLGCREKWKGQERRRRMKATGC